MTSLQGKTALVTGSGRGIGRSIALRLAGDGARVAVHYGSNDEAAAATVAAIEARGGSAFSIRARLEEPGAIETLWERFDERADGLDILVNNAGVLGRRRPFEEVDAAEFDEVFAVNVRAPFFLTQTALPRIEDGGRIVNLSTRFTRGGHDPHLTPYSMSKAAIDSLTATVAKAVGARGVTVNAVGPGATATDMNAETLSTAEGRERIASLSPLGRVALPEDVADIVAFLVSDDARWITGQWIDASGGSLL